MSFRYDQNDGTCHTGRLTGKSGDGSGTMPQEFEYYFKEGKCHQNDDYDAIGSFIC